MNKILTSIGLILSAAYCFGVYTVIGLRLLSLSEMPLNEIGDFLAGVFGPLAILWLILGFLQQGKELKQNTSALELQAEELRNSVKQQEELVQISREQFQANLVALNQEKERLLALSKPNLKVVGLGAQISGKYKLSCNMLNTGANAYDVEADIDCEQVERGKTKFSIWHKNEAKKFEFIISNQDKPEILNITFTFKNELDKVFTQAYVAQKTIGANNVEVFEVVSES